MSGYFVVKFAPGQIKCWPLKKNLLLCKKRTKYPVLFKKVGRSEMYTICIHCRVKWNPQS